MAGTTIAPHGQRHVYNRGIAQSHHQYPRCFVEALLRHAEITFEAVGRADRRRFADGLANPAAGDLVAYRWARIFDAALAKHRAEMATE